MTDGDTGEKVLTGQRRDEASFQYKTEIHPADGQPGHVSPLTFKIDRRAMSTLMCLLLLLSHGVLCLSAVDLPWQDQLCCESPPAHRTVQGEDVHVSEGNGSATNIPPRCSYRNSSSSPPLQESPAGTCLDILCTVDDEWQNFTCDLQNHRPPAAGLVAVSLRRLPSQDGNTEGDGDSGSVAPGNPVFCEAEDSFTCSLALDDPAGFTTLVTVSVSGSVAPSVLLTVPARPVKPSPPVNVSHVQTIDPELILQWDDPPHSTLGPLRYEVRYSANAMRPTWQVLSTLGEARLVLDLKPSLNYSVQVRCSTIDHPPLWSDWSESYSFDLYAVSYIPENAVVRPGENVTVYCVFNDPSLNASAARWALYHGQTFPSSQYRAVNPRVSQITARLPDTQLEHMLQCWDGYPYSHIHVDGAVIDIQCETNGDIDAMDCTWKNTRLNEPILKFSVAHKQCDEMQEEDDRVRPREGNSAHILACPKVHYTTNGSVCTIYPLSMSCYKLWLESPLRPIRSRPVYLTARDHVKPHPPSNVKAVSRSSGVLDVTWEPPSLPIEGLQCHFQYRAPSAVRAQPNWKVQSPVLEPRAQVDGLAMCGVYAVQVRCKSKEGLGYWSEWSRPVYSTPNNSRYPERGPDFWRILQDHPGRAQTTVTLLFEHLYTSGLSYCVDGFLIHHQSSSGSETKRIEPTTSYTFDWNRTPQNVTVKAFNSLGNSSNNSHMVLDRLPKRRCVRSFSVRLVNATCVSLSWTLLEGSSVPQFMVVQWFQRSQQGSDRHRGRPQGRDTWARLPYTDGPAYLGGDFFAPDDCVFYLYPVFADGEGEAVSATAKSGDVAVYQMLMIVSFLSVALFVTLIVSQHQMKKFVWKEVPDPSKCSWARGLDFRRVDPLDHMFRPADGLPAWPLLLPPPEIISKLVIVDKVDLSSLKADPTQDPIPADSDDLEADDPKPLPDAEPPRVPHLDTMTSFSPGVDPADRARKENSAQSLITYSTVLFCHPQQPQQQQQQQLCYKDTSASSSSDEGNFSANNSDISGSFPGGLWELDDPRRSCSFNSVEQLSETSEHGEGGGVRLEKDLFYLGLEGYAEDESEEEDQTPTELLRNVPGREGRPTESHPLLELENSTGSPPSLQAEAATYIFSPFYLPQFRTQPQDSTPQL